MENDPGQAARDRERAQLFANGMAAGYLVDGPEAKPLYGPFTEREAARIYRKSGGSPKPGSPVWQYQEKLAEDERKKLEDENPEAAARLRCNELMGWKRWPSRRAFVLPKPEFASLEAEVAWHSDKFKEYRAGPNSVVDVYREKEREALPHIRALRNRSSASGWVVTFVLFVGGLLATQDWIRFLCLAPVGGLTASAVFEAVFPDWEKRIQTRQMLKTLWIVGVAVCMLPLAHWIGVVTAPPQTKTVTVTIIEKKVADERRPKPRSTQAVAKVRGPGSQAVSSSKGSDRNGR